MTTKSKESLEALNTQSAEKAKQELHEMFKELFLDEITQDIGKTREEQSVGTSTLESQLVMANTSLTDLQTQLTQFIDDQLEEKLEEKVIESQIAVKEEVQRIGNQLADEMDKQYQELVSINNQSLERIQELQQQLEQNKQSHEQKITELQQRLDKNHKTQLIIQGICGVLLVSIIILGVKGFF